MVGLVTDVVLAAIKKLLSRKLSLYYGQILLKPLLSLKTLNLTFLPLGNYLTNIFLKKT